LQEIDLFLDVPNSRSSITENEKIPLQTLEKSGVAIKFNESIYEVCKITKKIYM
jgi:hypothetical protein